MYKSELIKEGNDISRYEDLPRIVHVFGLEIYKEEQKVIEL